MGEDGLGQWQLCGHEHGGPVDSVGCQNIFSDKMKFTGPPFVIRFIIRAKTDSRHIIDQCIKPDIGNVVGVKGKINPPIQARFRPGNAQIPERLL